MAVVSDAAVFATYVHDLNPVLLRITDAIQLRWYGLAYLAGFVGGFFLLRNLARRGLWVLKPEQTGDFIAAAALFGVFLGGRLGYVFFYQLPKTGWDELAKDPLMVLRVWEGGMASHGGILGLVIFTWFYARKHQVTWTGLGDGLCVVAPVGHSLRFRRGVDRAAAWLRHRRRRHARAARRHAERARLRAEMA